MKGKIEENFDDIRIWGVVNCSESSFVVEKHFFSTSEHFLGIIAREKGFLKGKKQNPPQRTLKNIQMAFRRDSLKFGYDSG